MKKRMAILLLVCLLSLSGFSPASTLPEGKDDMIPVPEYLTQYTAGEQRRKDSITFSIRCPCGNDSFMITESCCADEGTSVTEQPNSAGISVVKAVCRDCGSEIVVFDSRVNGYDGMTSGHEAEKALGLRFVQKGGSPYRIEITVENDPSLEAFQSATGIACTYAFYSDCFSWIRIYGIDETGRKTMLFDMETA